MLEVMLVALATGLVGYWNVLTKLPVAKLLYNLAAPCDERRDNNLDLLGICPSKIDDIRRCCSGCWLHSLLRGS